MKQTQILWTDICLNPESPRVQKKHYVVQGKLDADISSWSYDTECHAKKCVERYCELANKTARQLYHHIKEEVKSVGELSKVCSQIVLTCFYLARVGRPDILWSVNKFARSITKWTKACDKRFSRLISYTFIIHVNTNSIAMWETLPNICRLELFQDSDFAERS